MVTEEELKHFFESESTCTKTSYQVTASELAHFVDNDIKLAELISDRKKQYEKENNISATAAYFDIEMPSPRDDARSVSIVASSI